MKPELEPMLRQFNNLEEIGLMVPEFLHALKNHMTMVSGNLQMYGMLEHDRAGAERYLTAAVSAADKAGDFIEQFRNRYHRLAAESGNYSVLAAINHVALSNPYPGFWEVHTSEGELGCIHLEPRWLAASVWDTVTFSKAEKGSIHLTVGDCPKEILPSFPLMAYAASRYLRIEIVWAASVALQWDFPGHRPVDAGLEHVVAALRLVGGWLHSDHVSSRQHVCFYIPIC